MVDQHKYKPVLPNAFRIWGTLKLKYYLFGTPRQKATIDDLFWVLKICEKFENNNLNVYKWI